MQDQKTFIANAYEVEIYEGGRVAHSLKINDATSTFRSIKLDELTDRTNKEFKVLQSLNQFIAETQHKLVEDLTPEDVKKIESFENTSKRLRKINAEFLSLLIKDIEKYEDIIDSVGIAQRETFFATVRRASLGIIDSRVNTKKKLPPVKSNGRSKLKNSSVGDTPKKRSNRGTSTG